MLRQSRQVEAEEGDGDGRETADGAAGSKLAGSGAFVSSRKNTPALVRTRCSHRAPEPEPGPELVSSDGAHAFVSRYSRQSSRSAASTSTAISAEMQ